MCSIKYLYGNMGLQAVFFFIFFFFTVKYWPQQHCRTNNIIYPHVFKASQIVTTRMCRAVTSKLHWEVGVAEVKGISLKDLIISSYWVMRVEHCRNGVWDPWRLVDQREHTRTRWKMKKMTHVEPAQPSIKHIKSKLHVLSCYTIHWGQIVMCW